MTELLKKTPLMIIAENPEIDAIGKDLIRVRKETKKRLDEMNRISERIIRSCTEQSNTLWVDIEKKLAPTLPPDYSRDKYELSFENGVLFIEGKAPHDENECNCLMCRAARGDIET